MKSFGKHTWKKILNRVLQAHTSSAHETDQRRRNRVNGGAGVEMLEQRCMLTTWLPQDQLFAFSDPVDPVANSIHGWSVDVDGDVMAVGGENFVHVYRRSDAGTPNDASDDVWLGEARLTDGNSDNFDRFGRSLAVSGNTVVVGAYADNQPGKSGAGAAYVFSFDGTNWSQEAKLTADDAAGYDNFGYDVGIFGDTVVVGSLFDDFQNESGQTFGNAGSAYIFTRDGSIWSQQEKLIASDYAIGDYFGFSVDVSAEHVVVGSPLDDDGLNNSGSVYVFSFDGTNWIEETKLNASDAESSDQFGQSVAISGDSLIVGSPFEDESGSAAGAAYVFTHEGAGWSEQAKLLAPDGFNGDYFGWSVSIDGEIAVVGGDRDDDAGSSSGSAHLFSRNGSSWSHESKLTAEDAVADDRFGISVAASNGLVVVGSPQHDSSKLGKAAPNAGAAYLFTDVSGTWAQQDQLLAFRSSSLDPEPSARHGESVAVDGDLMVVGAYNEGRPAVAAGAAYVYRRDDAGTPLDISDDFWRQEARLVASDAAAYDFFGRSVSISGQTIVVGSHGYDGAGSSSGAAYVFTYDGTSWAEQAKLTASDAEAGDNFGLSVSVSGDSVVVGSAFDDDAGSSSGSAYVFVRSGTTWTEQIKLTADDAAENDQFGYSVAMSGDTVVVGSWRDNNSIGAAYVFSRNSNKWVAGASKLTASTPRTNSNFGQSVAISGDTVVVGDPGYQFIRDNQWVYRAGAAHVFKFIEGDGGKGGEKGGDKGEPTGWQEEAILVGEDVSQNAFSGQSVAISGDRIVVGARQDDVSFEGQTIPYAGSAFVFARGENGWSQETKLSAAAPVSSESFGNSVAISGDTIVAGSPRTDVAQDGFNNIDAGSAHVFQAEAVNQVIPALIRFTQAGFTSLTDPLLQELQGFLAGSVALADLSTELTSLIDSIEASDVSQVELIVDGTAWDVTAGVVALIDTTHIIVDPLGSQSNAALNGTDSTDFIFGLGGADVIRPGAGLDFVFGGAGNDTIEVRGSEILGDLLVGGSHFDQIVNLDVDGNYQTMVIAGFDSTTNGIERIDANGAAIVGTEDDNLFHFAGTELRNVSGVSTLGGNDTIHASDQTHDITYDGGEGDDTLVGGTRRDVLIGGAGNDDLTGGGNPDVLRPGAGDDTVDGGAGNDIIEVNGSEILGDSLVGGSHFDQLINLDGAQNLVIAGFDSTTNGIERIDAAGAAIVGTEDDNLFHFAGTELRNVSGVATLGGNDTIHASDQTHDITYDGGEGDDTLVGGTRRAGVPATMI